MSVNYLNFIKDKDKVLAALKKVGRSYYCTGGSIKIYFPEIYISKNMADIGGKITAYGVCCIVLDDKYYTVMAVPAKISVEPTSISLVDMGGEKYYEYYFEKGSMVIKDISVVKDMDMSYGFYELSISLGRYPWYIDYLMPSRVFSNSVKYAGIRVGSNKAISEILLAVTAKSQADHSVAYRHTLKKREDMEAVSPYFTPLGSVNQNATNTTAKLIGSYIGEGITSALVNESKQKEKIETLLRF